MNFGRNFAKFGDFAPPPPKFENFENNNLNIFKSIFKNSLKMNFGRNFAKFGDFGHNRNFLTNEIQNPATNNIGRSVGVYP